MRTSHCTHGIVLLLALSAAPLHAADLEVEPEDLQPGLVAHYRSLGDSRATLDRVEAKPAFHLGHSSPHPRLPPGPFEVVWTGVLTLQDPAPVSFDAFVSGEVTLEVDGVLVLEGRGQKETARVRCKTALERPPGLYRIKIRYRSLAGAPARLQIRWQGPAFSREPLPAWRLGHLADQRTPALRQEERIDQGRAAVGRFGCARCHQEAFPGISEPAPGPALNDVKGRLQRSWLLDWLEDPARLRTGACMPALFASGRTGFVERWLVSEHLLGPAPRDDHPAPQSNGSHRSGRRNFIGVGCAACHFLPDVDRAEQPDLGQVPLGNLNPRLPTAALAAFLGNPKARYPDGRCPPLPLSADMTRDIAAYLLLGSRPAKARASEPPSAAEIREVSERLGVHGVAATAATLVREKRCAACHPGLEGGRPADVRLTPTENRGCLAGRPGEGATPRFTLDARTRKALAAYRDVAAREKHPAPFADRQRRLERAGCVRCHQRDSDRPPPIEAIGSKLGGAWLQALPFQRTPRLTFPHQKFLRGHLLAAVRSGVGVLRPASYSYRMPAYGDEADALVQALAEGDGDLPAAPEPVQARTPDPTLGPLAGPRLVGFQGYGCVSCHVWNGKMLSEPDPGAVGTDLTRVVGRIRRDWLDRYLEGPGRVHPNTPMPTIFPRGQPAPLQAVLDGDAGKQKDALWSYFALGKDAPSPKPPPPLPLDSPRPGEPPLVAQIPVRLPDGKVVESVCLLTADHDLIVYDVGSGALHAAYTGAQILRDVHGRLRSFSVSGTPVEKGFRAGPPLRLVGTGKPETAGAWTFHGYDRLPEGVRIRGQVQLPAGKAEIAETLRITTTRGKRSLSRDVQVTGPAANSVLPATLRLDLPAATTPASAERVPLIDLGKIEGTLERPGYRAIAYPRPKTISGEDRVMPGAVAVNPRNGRVFVASMKTGELFVLRDPGDHGRHARFDNYARGLFEEAFSMHAESDALYVLHRRSLTRILEGRDGLGERFDRVAALPHGSVGTYDYAYGLARDRGGAFVLSYAPYANQHLPGSGGAVRLIPGRKPEEIAFGFRNPLGWCNGPQGEVFFTDNQGEWVATNKLCHLVEGRFYGFPNPTQKQHTSLPPGKAAVWVPYGWAKSINGVAYDSTEGKFGPFAGQLFLAELMFGGAIVRASLEKVNGEYQGACFPFWGPGLLGPLTLAFDPRGRLWVGGITEPGWMAQPDRGALFRIDFTGQVPFEMKSIHVLPRGFRIVFTKPVAPATARDLASYRVEHYRYEHTGAYGSPELDRTPVAIERVEVAADGRHVDLTLPPLVRDRVYLMGAGGVRSAKGERLVHPTGAYTLNEIPAGKR